MERVLTSWNIEHDRRRLEMAHVRHSEQPPNPVYEHHAQVKQVKGSDWLGDQDAIHYMTREAPRTVIEVRVLHTLHLIV